MKKEETRYLCEDDENLRRTDVEARGKDKRELCLFVVERTSLFLPLACFSTMVLQEKRRDDVSPAYLVAHLLQFCLNTWY